MWEIDGKFAVGLSFTVGISKLSKTWSKTWCIPSDCNPGKILGPYSLFDGWPLPPLVKIIFPKAGVDPEVVLKVIAGGYAMRVLDVRGPLVLKRNFQPGFKTRIHYKDLGIALAAGSLSFLISN
ncbi:MAG: NAD-binding protein [Candidatus Bathyarchaeia archaeon]|jgi:hypothetical protein